jgi:hypothetical protein
VNEVIELHSLDPRNYLFNGQEERDDCIDYLLGQGIINEASSDDTALFIVVFVCIQRVLQKSACNFG